MKNNQIKKICSEKKVTIAKMLNDLNLSPNVINKWENGADPKLSTIIKIADYLETSIDFIVGREEKGSTYNIKDNNSTYGDIGHIEKGLKSNELQPLEQEWLNQFRKMNKLEQLKELTRLEEKSKGDEQVEN